MNANEKTIHDLLAGPKPAWLPDTESDISDAAFYAADCVKASVQDFGIGPYEAWGQKCVHVDMRLFTDTEAVTVDLTTAIRRDVADDAGEWEDVREGGVVTAKLKGVFIVDRDGNRIDDARIIAEYGIEAE